MRGPRATTRTIRIGTWRAGAQRRTLSGNTDAVLERFAFIPRRLIALAWGSVRHGKAVGPAGRLADALILPGNDGTGCARFAFQPRGGTRGEAPSAPTRAGL